jgi:hypothetical protein
MLTKRMAVVVALFTMVGFAPGIVGPEGNGTTSSCATVLESQVCTWVVMEDGVAKELGATIPMAVIESVSAGGEMVWPPREMVAVPFPREAREALGVDHLGLNWEAHGHPPATFATPHFDFHFYSIDQDEVRAIDCTDESKPAGLPEAYALPDIDVPGLGHFVGLCVPAMGMHAMPVPEVDETEPFEASMLIGYYGRMPIFLEPMVSWEMLLKKSAVSLPVPEIDGLLEGVRYPRTFHGEYEAETDSYRLVFTGFDAQ